MTSRLFQSLKAIAAASLLAAASGALPGSMSCAQTPTPPSTTQVAVNDAYHPPGSPYGGGYGAPANDAYVPPAANNGGGYGGGYGSPYGGAPGGSTAAAPPPSEPGYGQPYTAPPSEVVSPPPVTADEYERSTGHRAGGNGFNQNEIITAGHQFFGSISQGLGKAIEYAFQSQGQPNGYILGEDAGGAFILGLRYGEGTLFTRDAGNHKVFWQGPSVGYDAGAEGSKTMVLVYNLSDPADIYNRFGGVQGAAYLIGGVSLQFQKYGDVTLGVIRSGVGLRLGANVGYSKYTRTPTWNPL